jgi:hypothetical protein
MFIHPILYSKCIKYLYILMAYNFHHQHRNNNFKFGIFSLINCHINSMYVRMYMCIKIKKKSNFISSFLFFSLLNIILRNY